MKKRALKITSLIFAILLMLTAITSCNSPETPDTGSDSSSGSQSEDTSGTQTELTLAQQTKIWRDATDERIADILDAPNMPLDYFDTVYYVSNDGDDSNDGTSPATAWKTLDKVNKTRMSENTCVCFERGGVWRGAEKATVDNSYAVLQTQTGVTYTAYGTGDKPKIYRSQFDAADPALWKSTGTDNIWVLQADWNDIGALVFNDGEAYGIKCIIRTESGGSTYNNTTGDAFNSYADLKEDLHFWHDYNNNSKNSVTTGSWKLYLYSEENPGLRFDSIELCSKGNIIGIGDGVSDVTVDNLCVKYTGSHGVGAIAGNDLVFENITVTNCEFGWIGGSIQGESLFNRNYGTRYGNAVEIYGGCDGFTVTDNYIYQIYDAAITQQYTEQQNRPVSQTDISYAYNVIEYANYSAEFWLKFTDGSKTYESTDLGKVENFTIENNYMWYAGMGLCSQRPDKEDAAHIKGWSGNCVSNNFVIRNNLMYGTAYMFVQINPSTANADGSTALPKFENNHFVGSTGDFFGIVKFGKTSELKMFTNIRNCLGSLSNGDKFWFED